MARDIEEFLRKAAERRQQAAKGNAQPTPPPAMPIQPPRRPVAPPTPQIAIPVAEEVTYRESIAEHVRKAVNSKSVSQSAARLGQEVALADDKLESRLHEKFDHTVSRLANTNDPPASKKQKRKSNDKPAAMTIFEMLKSPQNVGQAILLAEILKRPNFD